MEKLRETRQNEFEKNLNLNQNSREMMHRAKRTPGETIYPGEIRSVLMTIKGLEGCPCFYPPNTGCYDKILKHFATHNTFL